MYILSTNKKIVLTSFFVLKSFCFVKRGYYGVLGRKQFVNEMEGNVLEAQSDVT